MSQLIVSDSSLVSVGERGGATFSHATVRAHFKSQGYSGKELSKLVNETMSEHQASLVANVAGMVSAGNLQVAGVTRNKDGSKLTVRYAAPKIDKDKKISMLEKELAELRALRAQIEAGANRRLAAESAPDEPAVPATNVEAAFAAAGA